MRVWLLILSFNMITVLEVGQNTFYMSHPLSLSLTFRRILIWLLLCLKPFWGKWMGWLGHETSKFHSTLHKETGRLSISQSLSTETCMCRFLNMYTILIFITFSLLAASETHVCCSNLSKVNIGMNESMRKFPSASSLCTKHVLILTSYLAGTGDLNVLLSKHFEEN